MSNRFVAIVLKNDLTAVSDRCAFTGTDREAVIRRAIREKQKWEHNQNSSDYRIFLGTLTTEVIFPIAQYEVRPIEDDDEF